MFVYLCFIYKNNAYCLRLFLLRPSKNQYFLCGDSIAPLRMHGLEPTPLSPNRSEQYQTKK